MLPPAPGWCHHDGVITRDWSELIARMNAWKHLDWTVQADGYRLVIEDGAITGLAYDEWPYLWGDARYENAELIWSGEGSWTFTGTTPLMVSDDGVHFRDAPSIRCLRCGMTSYNENDIREGYCGNCHDWTNMVR